MHRIEKLLQLMYEKNIDGYFSVSVPHITYLTGFTGDSSRLFVTGNRTVLVTDGRYTEQASKECAPEIEIIKWIDNKRYAKETYQFIIDQLSIHNLAFEQHAITYSEYNVLKASSENRSLALGHQIQIIMRLMAIAMVGDGAMQMLGNNCLITAAKYWQRWRDPRLPILVLNNQDLNMVTWEQRIMAGDPKFEASQNLPHFSYARYAELLDLRGIRMEKPDDIVSGWEAALASDRPVVVEAITDPDVAPIPPHISLEQAKAFASAILQRDPNALSAVRQSVMELVQSYLPHREKE
ncbi:MAG: hypothetical protein HC830_07205 [Bacteroidetes bacterium]|nr:hypothetical protein [Bacteroidota bacterium]